MLDAEVTDAHFAAILPAAFNNVAGADKRLVVVGKRL